MIICAAKLRWKELSAILTLAAAFVLCLWGGRAEALSPTSAEAQASIQPLDYLTELGWEVSDEPAVDYVQLPDSFGKEYGDYLRIQQEGGFDLAAYAGETVTRYSYTVTNYPTGEANILADLLVFDGQVIGGDLRSPRLDGFMRALVARERL